MRIHKTISLKGLFWLPALQDQKVYGSLVIEDGGEIELETIGLFDDKGTTLDSLLNSEYRLSRIVGKIEKYGYVTLENCICKSNNNLFSEFSKSTFLVDFAFLGIAYDEEESIAFNSFQFSVEGIDEWFCINGFEAIVNYGENTATINYSRPDELCINLPNKIKLEIVHAWAPPGSPIIKEAKITQKTFFKLVSQKEMPYRDFVSLAHKCTTFLCFALDKTVCIENVITTCDSFCYESHVKEDMPIPIYVFYPSLPYAKNKAKIDRLAMLFNYIQIQDDIEKIINSWVTAYENIDTALSLYFSAKTGAHKYLSSKFLALVQGLEVYHRRSKNEKVINDKHFDELLSKLMELCPTDYKEVIIERLRNINSLSLRQRIKEIIEPFKRWFGTNREREKLMRAIVVTRNYLTHYDKSLKKDAADGRELLSLCYKLEAIFQLNLLQTLGFDLEQIAYILDNGSQLKKKIEWK